MGSKKRTAPAIGDEFEDRYQGEDHRVLRVVEVAAPDWKGRPRFVCETVRNDGRPWLVGKRTTVGAHTLLASFRKVTG